MMWEVYQADQRDSRALPAKRMIELSRAQREEVSEPPKFSQWRSGSISNAKRFSAFTKFPLDLLHLDTTGDLYKALGFYRGFLGEVGFVNPYLKFWPMLMGVGSPGTIPEVLRGYMGDKDASSAWIKQSLRLVPRERFDVVGKDNSQRPFELATIRLQNMMDVLGHWEELTPEDKTLITPLTLTECSNTISSPTSSTWMLFVINHSRLVCTWQRHPKNNWWICVKTLCHRLHQRGQINKSQASHSTHTPSLLWMQLDITNRIKDGEEGKWMKGSIQSSTNPLTWFYRL